MTLCFFIPVFHNERNKDRKTDGLVFGLAGQLTRFGKRRLDKQLSLPEENSLFLSKITGRAKLH